MEKFRLLAGSHSVQAETGKKDKDGNAVTATRQYRPGDVFDSDLDMTEQNVRGFNPKFEKVHPDADGQARVVLPPAAQIWDPSKETIEQFAARVSAPATLNVDED